LSGLEASSSAMLTYSAVDIRALNHECPPPRAVRKLLLSLHLWRPLVAWRRLQRSVPRNVNINKPGAAISWSIDGDRLVERAVSDEQDGCRQQHHHRAFSRRTHTDRDMAFFRRRPTSEASDTCRLRSCQYTTQLGSRRRSCCHISSSYEVLESAAAATAHVWSHLHPPDNCQWSDCPVRRLPAKHHPAVGVLLRLTVISFRGSRCLLVSCYHWRRLQYPCWECSRWRLAPPTRTINELWWVSTSLNWPISATVR